MHTFSVWSPHARTLEVDVAAPPGEDGSAGAVDTRPMQRGSDGWWHLEAPDAGHGTSYAYRVDGGEPTPDPRSGWQPDGVHGPSRVFDVTRHAWSDDGWTGPRRPEPAAPVPGADEQDDGLVGRVFYEMHVGTFTAGGTFAAAVDRLDELVDLGVDVVEVMPVAAFPGRWGWGYDGVHLYAVHEPYGGPAQFQRFVDACHTRGLGVCLDVVYNHLGPSGNYLSQFGPYFTDKHQTPWGQGVNLDDEGSEQVRRWIVDNALRWFRDFHVDCLRIDAVHALADESEVHLLAQLSQETAELSRRLARPLALVAESDLNDPRMVEPVGDGGLGMTGQWDDDVHHALHTLLTGERQGYYADFGSPEVLAKVMTRAFLHDGEFSTFRGEDWGKPVDAARHSAHRFLAYLQNHDQIGNRATGDRLGATLSPGQLAIGAALVLAGPFTPMLFMGEEWGASTPWAYFTEHSEPELAEAIREGRRREFAEHGWGAEVPDPQDPATRDASVLDWQERSAEPHARLLAWHRQLIALRRREPGLRDPRFDRVQVDLPPGGSGSWLVLHRGSFRLVVNLGIDDAVVPLAAKPVETVAAWSDPVVQASSVRLGGHDVALVRVE